LQHPNVLPYISGRPYPLSSPLHAYAKTPDVGAAAVDQLTESERRLTIAIVGLGPVGLVGSIISDCSAQRLIKRVVCSGGSSASAGPL
jgi:hypothetical protein